MESKKITVYEAEELVGDMMKVKRYERWMSEKDLPEIMKENEQRLYRELLQKRPHIEEVYEEYKEMKEKSKLEVVGMALTEENDYVGKDECGEYRVSRCVYKVINKECGKNIFGGILFDSEYLAIAYWYKANEIEHPKFTKLLQGTYGTKEDKLLYAIFGVSSGKKGK